MPDLTASLIGIFVLGLATYLTRITGYFLGSRVLKDSMTSRVLETLPGAALASVLALSLRGAAFVELIAVIAGVAAFLMTGRALVGILVGLAIAVANAHWLV